MLTEYEHCQRRKLARSSFWCGVICAVFAIAAGVIAFFLVTSLAHAADRSTMEIYGATVTKEKETERYIWYRVDGMTDWKCVQGRYQKNKKTGGIYDHCDTYMSEYPEKNLICFKTSGYLGSCVYIPPQEK